LRRGWEELWLRSPLYANAGYYTELSTTACTGNTSGSVEGTLGAWWRVLHGNYGTAMVSFRYLPFQ